MNPNNNLLFQDKRSRLRSAFLHGGSLETAAPSDNSNIIELTNFAEYGPSRSAAATAGMMITKAAGDFGSLDSSDTFLSCNTHPFPSQGSLAGLEALAAQGSMAPNGSINNCVYVNPFDPARRRNGGNGNGGGGNSANASGAPVTPSPKGSPARRVRIAARSRSSDLCDLDVMDRETWTETAGWPPKHRRMRMSQVESANFLYILVLMPGRYSGYRVIQNYCTISDL